MDVRNWTTLSRLLDEAFDLAPTERTTWIEGLAAEYEAFKPRLRAMLEQASLKGETDFLATLPKFDLASEDDEADGQAEPGTRVGAFRLLRQLAAGGQASVWLAERVDGLVNRPVAIKLPHAVAYRPGFAERLSRERDILATLNHPHIARLYDAGITPEGAPFLALEYVEGTPIDRHCLDRGLDVRARVGLFLQVVRAVAYAHGQLVIHRDLKPSNVLVTADGQVRLLDFGIARMLDETAAGDSMLTDVGGRAMTLEYASPEQVSHSPLGVATDIYSLGVMLYDLLAGVRPYQPSRDSPAALEEAILQTDPARPSDRAIDPAVRKQLRGDLDTIVLEALKKAPEDRYLTAAALGEDLERYLAGRPVRARADSWWYRARKFVARNRVAVGAAAAALVAIVIGSGAVVWQMIEARDQRDIARLSQRRAEAFSEFMKVLLQDAGAGGRPLTAAALLDRGTEILDRQHDVDESVAAYMRYEISRNYTLFNQTERELALLERSAEGARRLGDTSLLAAAECSAAWALVNRDRGLAEAKLAEAERVLGSAKNASIYSRADCLRARSRLLQASGDVPGAIAALEQGLAILDADPVQNPSRRDLLMTQLTEFYRATDRFKDALLLSERSLDAIRSSGRAGSLVELTAINNVAGNLNRVGEVLQGAELQAEVVARVEAMDLRVQPVGARFNLGFAVLRLGQSERALELADADTALAERVGNTASAAISHLLASRALLALGRSDDAWRRLRLAETIWNADSRMHARMLTEAALQRAELYLAAENISQARSLQQATLTQLGYPERQNAPGLDRVLQQGARIALLSDDASSAESFAAAALEVSRQIARDERHSADVGEAALLRAQSLIEQRRFDEAVADASLAVDALRHSLGAEHTQTTVAVALLDRLRAKP